jgi:hypothetical protein
MCDFLRPKARQRTDFVGCCDDNRHEESETMTNPLARFPDAGSFVAGLMIGLSILLPVFAIAVAEPGAWQGLWILGALTILVLGVSLQALVTARPRHPRTTVPEPGAMRIRLGLRP